MWTDPDVKTHNDIVSDFKLSNLFEKLIIKAEVDKVGDYVYDVTGETTKEIDIYDVSTAALMEKYYELVDNSNDYDMINDDNYKSVSIAVDLYNNSTLYPLILLMNGMTTNAEFYTDGSKTSYKALSESSVNDILFNKVYPSASSVKEVTNSEEYTECIKNLSYNVNKANPTMDQLLEAKDKQAYNNIEKSQQYLYLLNKLGKDKLTKVIKKLTTYSK